MLSDVASAAVDARRADEARRAPPPLRPLLRLLSPQGRRARLTTLIFHRVRPEPDALFPNEMHAASFRERLRWIREWFNVVPLEDAVVALARGTLQDRALAITFDDGYADNFDVALPLLREQGLPATFFVAAGYLDGGRMWNDTVIEAIQRTSVRSLDLSALGLGVHALGSTEARRRTIDTLLTMLKYLAPDERLSRAESVASLAGGLLPGDLMMSSEQIRGLAAAGMGVGGHTLTHPILTRSNASTARREIADGRDALEAIIRQRVCLFAYPNGKPRTDYAAEHVKMVRDLGFAAAVSTSPGAARAEHSVFELPRFTPWEATAGRWGYRLALNLLRSPRTVAS